MADEGMILHPNTYAALVEARILEEMRPDKVWGTWMDTIEGRRAYREACEAERA